MNLVVLDRATIGIQKFLIIWCRSDTKQFEDNSAK